MLKILLVSPVIGLALAGCNTVQTPIMAVAADDVGVVAAFKPAAQGGASLTVGYKGAKFAVLPVENQERRSTRWQLTSGQETPPFPARRSTSPIRLTEREPVPISASPSQTRQAP